MDLLTGAQIAIFSEGFNNYGIWIIWIPFREKGKRCDSNDLFLRRI